MFKLNFRSELLLILQKERMKKNNDEEHFKLNQNEVNYQLTFFLSNYYKNIHTSNRVN